MRPQSKSCQTTMDDRIQVVGPSRVANRRATMWGAFLHVHALSQCTSTALGEPKYTTAPYGMFPIKDNLYIERLQLYEMWERPIFWLTLHAPSGNLCHRKDGKLDLRLGGMPITPICVSWLTA